MALTVRVQRIAGAKVYDYGNFSTIDLSILDFAGKVDENASVTLFFEEGEHQANAEKIAEAINLAVASPKQVAEPALEAEQWKGEEGERDEIPF